MFRHSVAHLCVLFLAISQVDALQMLLTSMEPMCIFVKPKTVASQISVQYFVTGMNEDKIQFTASQNGKQLTKISGAKDKKVNLSNKGSAEVQLCWTKSDKKSKKVTFTLFDNDGNLEEKATVDTVESLQSAIDGL